jgi:hypothetical protein
MWIWYVSAAGGSAQNIAQKAHNHNVDVVLIKSSDGPNTWSQFSPELVRNLHRRGMRVCAWQFVYGSQPRKEALRGAEAVHKGADCLVIDAESSYEGRYVAADKYVRVLRRHIDHDFPLALAGFPWADYHESFPYTVFLGLGGAELNLPQIYWRAIGVSVDEAMSHTYRWNLVYDRPILPLGQTYQDPPSTEIRRFRRLAVGYGARGVSWWSWQHTDSGEWHHVGSHVHGPWPDPPRRFPRLSQGARGDTVVQLQSLLRGAGKHVGIDGVFASGTASAIRRFQDDHGLQQNGVADGATWRALRDYRPVRIKWGRHGNPTSAKSAQFAPRYPDALEVPSTPGRP